MSNPLISIIIPTYNRPQLLPRAVESALSQTIDDFEVIVVDDCSPEPVNLSDHPRLHVIRLPENQGTAAARNTGARAARGHYITYLDDDDQLLPHMAEVSLKGQMNATLPQPVAVLSGLQVVSLEGNVVETRLPPTLPRGSHFFLEKMEPGKSFVSKQTLVVDRELFLSIGGYDETFQSRVHTELFLRLNPVCSILGLSTVTYQLMCHEGPRISNNLNLHQVSFHHLVNKHEHIFKSHPQMFARFLYIHARKSYKLGQRKAAFSNLLWAVKLHPRQVSSMTVRSFKKYLRGKKLRPTIANLSRGY